MSDQDPGVPVVKKPFDMESKGDCVLRTSDGAEFKVVRAILCLASSVFDDMFTIPQGPHEVPAADGNSDQSLPSRTKDGLPVVELSENAATLDILLRCIYPTTKPTISSFDSAMSLAKASEKYLITSSVLSPIYSYLTDNVENPPERDLAGCWVDKREHFARAYSLSWRLGFKKLCIKASRRLLEEKGAAGSFASFNIGELAGDPAASSWLYTAYESRLSGVRELASIGSLRIGYTFCDQCLATWTTMLEVMERLEAALDEELRAEASPLNLDHMRDVLMRAEQKVASRNLCQLCASGAKYIPPRPKTSYRIMDKTMEVEIRWPQNKEDNTP